MFHEWLGLAGYLAKFDKFTMCATRLYFFDLQYFCILVMIQVIFLAAQLNELV